MKKLIDFGRKNLAWVLLVVICIIFSFTSRVYPKICVNSNEAVQNANQLRESEQRIYPMSACVHHSMPDGRSQGRREVPFIAAPTWREDP